MITDRTRILYGTIGLILVGVLICLVENPSKWNMPSLPSFKSDKNTSSSSYPGEGAQDFVEERLKSTIGNLVEVRRVQNGAYFGFPQGDDVYTFDGTCLTNRGAKNVIIAIKGVKGGYSVVKVHVN